MLIPLTLGVHKNSHDDKDFIAGMTPHHRDAIDMAEILLKYGKNPRVRELAKQIIREQEKEIILVEELLKELNQYIVESVEGWPEVRTQLDDRTCMTHSR